jgi:plasmid maintenance system antidote protein VapI
MPRTRQPVRVSASLQSRYLAGEFNQSQLAEQLGVKVRRLRKELIRLGLPTSPPGGRRRVARTIPAELVEAYGRGELNIADIAAALRVSCSTAWHRLREQGVARPRQPVRISASLQRRYLAGELNQGQLAEQLGVTAGRLRNELIRLGLPTYSPASRRRVAPTIPVELVEAYIRGELTADAIAVALGVSHRTVTHRLRDQGVHIRNIAEATSLRRLDRHVPQEQEIQQLRAQGWTLAAIGAREGISRQRVHQILKRAATRQGERGKGDTLR